MSTQDDPENFPWQSGGMTGGGMVYSDKIHSSFLVNQNIVHSSWLSAATDAPDGAQATLAASRAQIGGRHRIRYSRRTVTFITPGTASIIMKPQPPEVKVSDHTTVLESASSIEGNHETSPIPASSDGSTPHAEPCKTIQPKANWVKQLSWGIPKQLREQIVGDLCEIRAKMAAEGYSSPQIMWTTLSQLLLSIPWWLWSRFGWIVLLYNRVSEWFSPNK